MSRPRTRSMAPSSSEAAQEVLNRRLGQYNPLGDQDNTMTFLRNFFDVLPPAGQQNLAHDVRSCGSDHKIRQIVDSIRTGLVCPLRAIGGRTPSEITGAPRPGIEDSIENLRSMDVRPINRTPQQRLREHCLERDGYCCILSGLPSQDHPHAEDAMTVCLEAAHIVPFALGSFDANNPEATHRNATIWVSIRRYFPALRAMAKDHELINHESNVMMLEYSAHKEFGEFHFILEATAVPNQYRIIRFPNATGFTMSVMPSSGLVQFTAKGGSSWALPNSNLLRVHAAIGNFIHLMGMGEKLDKLMYDYDGSGGLAPSGSTDVAALFALRGLSLLSPNTFVPRVSQNVSHKNVDEAEAEAEAEAGAEEEEYSFV